jgi:hypothetical protein
MVTKIKKLETKELKGHKIKNQKCTIHSLKVAGILNIQKVPECIIHFLYIMTTLKKIIHIDEELKYLILIEMMYSKDTRYL